MMDKNRTESSTLCCRWCGISLAGASRVTVLNGNLACCDICLLKVGLKPEWKESFGKEVITNDRTN